MRNGTTENATLKVIRAHYGMAQSGIRIMRCQSADLQEQINVIDKWKMDYGARVNCQMTAP
jgi:hypothetical protein